MSQSPSPKSSKNPDNPLDSTQRIDKLSPRPELGAPQRQAEPRRQQSGRRERSLKSKVLAIAIAIGTIPPLIVGTVTYMSNQSFQEELEQAGLLTEKIAFQNQLSLLGLGTAATAAIAGAIAAIAANRTLRPVLNAAETSNQLVNRLRREDTKICDRVAGKDELVALKTNLSLLNEQLPDLLWKQEAEAERFQILMKITRRLREARSQEEVLRFAVEEVRQSLRTDRVAIFRFDANSNVEGVIVEESVAAGWPKMLWATLSDACLEEYVELYRNGRVRAIDDIHNAGLNDCHIGLLERFAVKANLIAPILKNNRLFALLIANQCSAPRYWQAAEIDLFAQIATQVGFALDYTQTLEQLDTKFDRAQLFIEITRRIRESLVEEDILKTTVDEVRKAIRSDRVVVYSFDEQWYGTVVAESVVPGLPKAIHARIKDPCFAEGYVEQYQAGRVQATPDIYKAGLTECHLRQLEPFAVKANLVAPILKDGRLFGLLIAHQCSAPRNWQQSEIDFLTQIAMQVGFALDQARLLERMDSEAVRTELLAYLSRRIRESLSEESILNTTVEEIRKAIRADRAVVYRFNSDWSGYIAAESVLSGWTHALEHRIEDPCIPEQLRQAYLRGRVVPTSNVFEAGFHPDHLQLMKRLEIKANLVAPIIKDNRLFGLLILHQCSSYRTWQRAEIDLVAQLALQVGLALDHAQLLSQLEQAYHRAEGLAYQQRQQKEVLLAQVAELLRNSQTAVETLSTEAMSQMESVTAAYNQIKEVNHLAQTTSASAQQVDMHKQQVAQTVQFSQRAMGRIVKGMAAIQETALAATEQVKRLDRPSCKLAEIVDMLSQVASQMKLQAMNAALEAARTGEAGKDFAAIGEKVLALARQLDADIAAIAPLIEEIQVQTRQVAAAIGTGQERAIAESQVVSETQKALQQIATVSERMNALVAEIVQSADRQAQTSASASQSVLNIANLASRTSEQSMAVVESFNKLAAVAHQLQSEKP
ncbi:methyl-accepting chemotaxis protein [Pleurocapsa sp. PCC 7327]|uniref:methyl-accepting chemotaxis protein n=1 Tax=Pleurocapsa sp. PCC 7327 TaxID=118163 RepID=UPI00029F8657|nr:GAF domain-containing protein [Pleurocapsa sp. PCC 7327]AFY75892.1 methyl-accepting chemotaxis protein [Pleurocapsa sp. PCC 7327]